MRWRNYSLALLDNLIWIILIGVFAFFVTQSEKFLTSFNIRNILIAASVLGVMAVGQTFVLITGNFDLSTESTLGLAALIGLWVIVPAGVPYSGGGFLLNPYLSMALTLLLGAGVGYLIGSLITFGQMNNFIVTLAMLLILRGAMLAFTGGSPVSGLNFDPAEVYFWLGHETAFVLPWLGKVPVSVLAMLLVFVVAHFVLKYTKFGVNLYAIGGNRDAAKANGIDVDRRVRQAYLISGLLAAFAGWMLAGRVGSIQINLGEGYVFTIFAAAVIGGISLNGGRGTVLGVLGGVLLLSTIDRGLNLMRVSVFWVKMIQGLTILIAMVIDAQRTRLQGAIYMGTSARPGASDTPSE